MGDLPAGVFGGTLEGEADGTFVLVTRDLWGAGRADGRLFYGVGIDGPARVGGVVMFSYGYGCNSADVRAANATKLPRGTPFGHYDAYLYATLDPATPTVAGSLRSLDGKTPPRAFSGGPVPGSTYKPRAVPLIYDVAGHWTIYDAAGGPGHLLVGSDGTLEGSYQGCAIRGAVQPAADGSNLFDVHLTVRACFDAHLRGEEYVGYLVVLPSAGGGAKVLFYAEGTDWMTLFYLLAAGER